MRRNNLVVGILCALAGLVCLLIALLSECGIEGVLWGLAGAGIGLGAAMIGNYLYREIDKARYSERLENAKIEAQDELMQRIRDRSGRCAHVLGIVATSISIFVFMILDALKIIPDAGIVIWFLSGYLVFQIAARIVIFNRILKKY